MRFRKFILENYRAVEYAEVAVANNLIPLVGINESGKTTILQGILAFDRLSDSYAGGTHLEYRNKYVLGNHSCNITAEVVLDSEEDLDKLSQRLRLVRGNPLMLSFEEAFRNGSTLRITRNLETLKYSIQGISLPDDTNNEKVADAVYRILPFLLYFDDFTDRVPEAVEYIPTDKGIRIANRRLGEWDRILREIFRRATDGRQSLESFIEMENDDERRGLLSDITDVLNEEIIQAWRKLRERSGNLADDTGDLSLHLGYRTTDGRFVFEFKVTDRAARRERWFNVVDRSKGFQWFFNFQMKLKFNPKYQEVSSGAIYLLDEPGSYLHASAQAELLSSLHEISETNTILYCTHSQHLLDPDKINIADTRIVYKENGKVSVIPFGSAKTRNYQGALTPLIHALHIRTGVFNREIRNAVITEGITDYYFFSMLCAHRDEWSQVEIDLIPGAGAAQLRDLISMAIAFSHRFCVLLDSDQEGIEARNRYLQFFGQHLQDHFFGYATPGRQKKVRLEGFLSERDRTRLLTMTGVQDVKNAVIQLYFRSDREQYWKGIDEETIENLSIVQGYLKNFFSAE